MADDNNEMDFLVSLLSRFENTSNHPETYLKPPVSLEKDTVATVKQLFDFCKKDEPNGSRSLASTCPLQELLVEDFDVEQIWQEIELQNTPLLRLGKQDVQNIIQKVDKLSLLLAARKSKCVKGNQLQGIEDEIVVENANGFVRHSSGSESEGEFSDKDSSHDENSDEQMDNADDNDENEDFNDNVDDRKVSLSSRQNTKQKPSTKKSQVDDTFFKLSDMIQFLDKEDRKFERAHQKKNQSENIDDDDSCESESELVDYFMDIESDNTNDDDDDDNDDDDDDDDDWNKALDATKTLLGRKGEFARKGKKKRKTAGEMKYADFFDPPDGGPTEKKGSDNESEDENEDDEEMEAAGDDDKEQMEDDEAAASSDNEMDSDEETTKGISSFEKKQQKLKEKIEKLEKANLAKKPWQMLGETAGNVRPINSLLQEDISFDHTTTTAPDITEETTQNLEDIVKQRIKDEAWDDVERKVKPVTEPFEYKKKLPLDQEKSKLSLSQIYEQEYLKQTQVEAEEKENEEHAEIKALMSKLFTKLDALSNFHFTPKPPKPELKVVSHVPVISVEEVAPVSVSDAMMLAPEEIHEKKKEQKGKTELTDTDRKRERRAKKRRQHERAVEKEKRRKLVEKFNPGLGNKYSKKAALEKLEKDHKSSKNVSLLKDEGNGKPVKSSAAFFSRLQDEVKDQVKAKKETKKKKSSVKFTQLKL